MPGAIMTSSPGHQEGSMVYFGSRVNVLAESVIVYSGALAPGELNVGFAHGS